MSAEEIKEYEDATGMPMEEIVSRLEAIFEQKDYTVRTMTITELKKIVKHPEKVSEADRLKYEKYNGCNFEMVITLAEARTAAFDNDRENRQKRGLEQRIRREIALAKKAHVSSMAMAAMGIGEYDEETGVFASDDFIGMMAYGSSATAIWDRLLAELSSAERNIHMMPEVGKGEEYFHVSVGENRQLVIAQSSKKPYRIIPEPIFLLEKDCGSMYELYRDIRNGYEVDELAENAEFWLGIFKYFRMPYK
jgi:hypothetical protein